MCDATIDRTSPISAFVVYPGVGSGRDQLRNISPGRKMTSEQSGKVNNTEMILVRSGDLDSQQIFGERFG